MKTECAYCERMIDLERTELSGTERVCKDRRDCARAEDQAWRAYVAELRKRKREGDDLTDKEAAELAEG